MYIVGLIGSVLVCTAYFLLIRGRVGAYDYRYLTTNLIGGSCLFAALLSPFQINNLGPAILQAIMISITLYGFYKARRIR